MAEFCITDVRIKLMDETTGGNGRLHAFASIVIDDAFVVRDMKIIGVERGLFVAMPSRKLMDRCGHCGTRNHFRARFCNQCGGRLDENRALRDPDGHAKLHADVAHPIHQAARGAIHDAVLRAYEAEQSLAKEPGYVSRYDAHDDPDEEAVHPPPSAPVRLVTRSRERRSAC